MKIVFIISYTSRKPIQGRAGELCRYKKNPVSAWEMEACVNDPMEICKADKDGNNSFIQIYT